MQTANVIDFQKNTPAGVILQSTETRVFDWDNDYLAKLRRSEMQIEQGEVVTLSPEQLKAFEF